MSVRIFLLVFYWISFHRFAALAWTVTVLWLWRVLPALALLPRIPDLHDARFHPRSLAENSQPVEWASITVVVPARNEAKAIAATLHTLLTSDYPNLKIIAVDDRSIYGTGELMEAAAASSDVGDKNLLVLHVTELPAGWLGKPYAMALAAASADSDWLLFTDGDVRFAPDVFGRAMIYAEQSRADHIVVYPTMIVKGLAERGFLAFFQNLSVWAGRPWKISDARAKRDFIGVGAFNMIRRSVYEELGGYAVMPMEVLEDMCLGYRVKHAGYAQRVAFARDMIRIRWAESVMGMVENLTKNIFAAFRFRSYLLLAACVGILLLCLTPFAALAVSGPARWAGIVTLIALLLLHLRYWPQTRLSPLYLAFFSLGMLLLLYTLLRSLVLTHWRGGVLWRGTLYPLAELRREAGRWR